MTVEVNIVKKLAAFNLEVAFKAEDETLGLLGESGCGKSMTMRCIAGIERPDAGRIVVNGVTYFDSSKGINLKPQQRKTALLFQNYMLFPHFTVEANIAAGIGKDVSSDERRRIVQGELERFGLVGLEKRYPMQLSGGQQQRVALARMLAARPAILMLDEPFSALDSHLKGVLEQNLISLFDAFDGSILYVSHDIDEAVRFCNRIAVVNQGQIAELATPDDLVNHPTSEAGLKLSGCKNVSPVERLDDCTVRMPRWGIDVSCESVPADAKYLGIRAFYIEDVNGPGENNFRVRVTRSSDSRFDRSLTLQFLDRGDGAEPMVTADDNEMRYLHQVITRRISKLAVPVEDIPNTGDELWIHLPKEHLYLVSK